LHTATKKPGFKSVSRQIPKRLHRWRKKRQVVENKVFSPLKGGERGGRRWRIWGELRDRKSDEGRAATRAVRHGT